MKTISVAIFIVIATAGSAAAQDSPSVFWRAAIQGGDVTPTPRTFELFGATNEIRANLAIQNTGSEPILLDVSNLIESVAVSLDVSGMAVPVTVEWEPNYRTIPGIPQVDVLSWVQGERLLLAPEAGAEWTLVLRQATGVFSPAEYRLTIDIRSALLRAVLTADGTVWRGRASPQTILTVLVRSVQTPADAVRADRQRARTALNQGRESEAIEHLSRAASQSPNDPAVAAQLGSAYLRAKLFREAVTWLERALAFAPPGGYLVLPDLLALAYVGNGNEETAINLLQSRGRSSAQANAEVQRLRGVAKRPALR